MSDKSGYEFISRLGNLTVAKLVVEAMRRPFQLQLDIGTALATIGTLVSQVEALRAALEAERAMRAKLEARVPNPIVGMSPKLIKVN